MVRRFDGRPPSDDLVLSAYDFAKTNVSAGSREQDGSDIVISLFVDCQYVGGAVASPVQ
jgi:hypothetical protein